MEREKVITLLRLVKENGLKIDIAADEICSLFSVRQQRELLKAYFEWVEKQDMNIESYQKSYLIDEFLDSL